MTTTTVRAVKAFEYEGRVYHKGEMVTMAPAHAAIHARKGHVSLTRLENRQLKAGPPPPVAVRARRKYQRRDLTTQDTE